MSARSATAAFTIDMTPRAITEQELIERFFAGRGVQRDDVACGIGDDAAVLRVPDGCELVATVDAIVEGVHFLAGASPADVGHRALAVNLSDVAAMGAEPAWALLALVIPGADEQWLGAFGRGFFELADRFGVALVGGDTNRGPLCVSVQLHGFVATGAAITRSGARAGDALYVTGTLGDAAAGLALERDGTRGDAHAADELRMRFLRPEPRVHEGRALRGLASAAIDVSDGLVIDAARLARASGVGIELELEHLPMSGALRALHGEERARALALGGGDDYELLFTARPEHAIELARATRGWPSGCTRIGRVVPEPGVRARLQGREVALAPSGYQHF
jgi:thiamine-monophosphate kinase